MAEAIVSPILEQLELASTANVERLKDIVGRDEVEKLKGNLVAVQPVLEDAEKRQVVDNRVKTWLEKLQGASYDIEDVLDEWNSRAGKLQIKEVEEAPKLWKKASASENSYKCLLYSERKLPQGGRKGLVQHLSHPLHSN